MQKIKELTISEAEWEVMRVVWANIEVRSSEVISVLQSKMTWKESTIKTLMGRLVDKEALNTRREGRAFIYSANISEEESVESYSKEILGRVCNTKEVLVVRQLIEDAKLSQSNIDDLIHLLEDKQASAVEEVHCNCTPGQCDCHLL